MSYKFCERDKNEETLIGILRGDTPLAGYTFISEGVSSVLRVSFMKKGNTHTLGYADMLAAKK